MISLETRINGMLIGYACIQNELIQNDSGDYLYGVEYHRFNKEPDVIKFNVMHKREDGAEKLLFLVYEEIDQILKKGNSSRGK